ncbi:hypothetical protein BDV59DRAFT_196125 [Aspergillus ambiguus]|uniref:uncharacterized protein n=1 Tax=Aspergillus ambiguus TaxID=176160 RepID=UPI003CCD7FE2
MYGTDSGDRTLSVPPHTGYAVLPHMPFFEKLLRYASRSPPRVAIRDVNLRDALGADVHQRLANDDEVFIGLLAAGGYEYAVGFIAILAIGAAVVPLCMLAVALPVDEAKSLVLTSRCVGIMASVGTVNLARSVASSIKNETQAAIPCLGISNTFGNLASATEILISSDKEINPNNAALVIFTSGTTGPPKGAVQRRSYITAAAEEIADYYQITEKDVILHMLPVHHVTGVGINFLPYMVSGACVEFRSGSFDAAWTWERLKRRYFESHLSGLPEGERREDLDGARKLRALLCGTSTLPAPILTRYGATEFGAVLRVDFDPGSTPQNSVGRVPPGVSLKLADDGMVLVKAPHMFAKYLNDEKATKGAHDQHGFFKTGDIARKEGNYYFILGRASLDIIKSGGYKISALDIEREILGLTYVSEVIVVGVEDEEFGQRVGAIVSLKDSYGKVLTLSALRRDL